MDLLAGSAERISVVSGKRAALSTVTIRPNGLSAGLNDKGRSHQRPQVPFLKGMEFRAETVYSRTASANTGILEARLWLVNRDRALLAIRNSPWHCGQHRFLRPMHAR